MIALLIALQSVPFTISVSTAKGRPFVEVK